MIGNVHSRRRPIVFAALACASLVAVWSSALYAQSGRDVVAEINVVGNRLVPTAQILRHISTRVGQEYSTAQVQKDIERLSTSGLFQRPPRVTDRVAPDGRISITYEVFEYPNVVRDVIFRHANHIPEKELESMVRVRKGMPLDPVRNKLACYEIQDFLKRKGRLFANVTLEEGFDPTHTRVIFNVTEGPVVRVRSVSFTGNEALASQARLKTQVGTSKAWFGVFGGVYEPLKVDDDVKKLEDYYKANGYLSARVNRELRFSADFSRVDLVFHIEEGVRYRVDSVSVEAGGKIVPRKDLESVVQVKKNDFYNESKVAQDVRYLQDYAGWRAIDMNVQKSLYVVPEQPGLVRVVYEGREKYQEPAKVGNVYVTGNEVTQDRVIRRTLGLYPGQYLRYPEVRIAESNLARLNIFEANPETGVRPTVTVIDNENSVYKDIIVNVKETHTGSLMFGAGINSDAGLIGSIVLNERNFDLFRPPTSWADIVEGRAFRGAGQEFRIEAQPGTELQRYTVSWREPFLFDRPISLGTSAYYFDRVFNEYVENRYGGRVTLGHQFTPTIGANVGVRMENVEVSRLAFGAPKDYTDALGSHLIVAPRVGVTYDTRDSFMRPTEGGILDMSYEHVLGDYNFPIFNVEGSRFFTTWQRPDGSGKHVLAARAQFSWAGDDAPVFERFYAGGFRSLRGFQFRGVGPFDNGFNVGGHFMALASLEYQIPIKANDNLYLVGFLDTGTVERNLEITDYRVTAGLGLRIIVPALGPVPIALDFGFPIRQGKDDREQMFSFWVGLFR